MSRHSPAAAHHIAITLLPPLHCHLSQCSRVAARHVTITPALCCSVLLSTSPSGCLYSQAATVLLPMLCIAATVVAGATGITILWLPLGCACTHNLMRENKETKKSTTYH